MNCPNCLAGNPKKFIAGKSVALRGMVTLVNNGDKFKCPACGAEFWRGSIPTPRPQLTPAYAVR